MNEQNQKVSEERPDKFILGIYTEMLESLGLNMYTSVGKSLVEFVANGYDSNATKVEIIIPFADINKERIALREKAKAEVSKGGRDSFTVLQDTLPTSLSIVIKDDGHGMSASDIQKKFLMINRNRRREDGDKSEGGLRNVMGRKGLGKLAGFGTAEQITVVSKRAGDTYSTTFVMGLSDIRKFKEAHQAVFMPTYTEGLDPKTQGTTITLSGLRCDAMKASPESIKNTLAQNFAVLGEGFKIELNDEEVKEENVKYEFYYPSEDQCTDGYANQIVKVAEIIEIPIRYRVKFRARQSDGDDAGDTDEGSTQQGDANDGVTAKQEQGKKDDATKVMKRSLPARLRGARIYCNQRLAAGPSLLKLETGMHNFHSQSYMECIVHADALDTHKDVDHIGTSRTDLKSDNEVVDTLYDEVTEIMRKALYEHSVFREAAAEKRTEKDDFTQGLLKSVSFLPKSSQAPARKVIQVLAANHGVQSSLYREVAPLMLKTMSAAEVLTRLIELGTDPKSVSVVAHELAELSKIEAGDALKLYRGRRFGIDALSKLEEKAQSEWKEAKFEAVLHQLLKEQPWLIQPEYSRYLTSDKPMSEVAKKLDEVLKIDTGLPKDYEAEEKDDKRPDLVFVLVDSSDPATVSVVEIKSPNLALNTDHLTQLKGYMMKTRNILKADYQKTNVRVHGYLVGSMPRPDTKAEKEQLFLEEVRNLGPNEDWMVLSLPQMLQRARKIHLDAIGALEEEEKRLEDDLS